MKRGIYITANDRVIEQALALMNSIRLYDPDSPVILIPYDNNYQKIADLLSEKYGVILYPDLQLVEELAQKIYDIFGEKFFARPNQFRKQVYWFGELDQFLYIDTDIVVFEKIIDNLNFLDTYDFLCCDYQHKKGITDVFNPIVLEQGIFTENDLSGMFNGGFWASKKNLFSEQELLIVLFKNVPLIQNILIFLKKPPINRLLIIPFSNEFPIDLILSALRVVKREIGGEVLIFNLRGIF